MNKPVAVHEHAFVAREVVRFELPRSLLLLLLILLYELVFCDDQLVRVVVLDKLLLLVARGLFRTGQLRFQIGHWLRSLRRFNRAT